MAGAPTTPQWDLESSPFHDGELSIQERLGVREKIDAQARRAIRRYMTEQHRAFYPLLSYAFMGSVDENGQPWASMLVGEAGFLQTPDPYSLQVTSRPLFGDPLGQTLREGAEVALLGVQLHTRRRNRVIGHVSRIDDAGFRIAVRQTLGVCPQYIQGREVTLASDPLHPEPRPMHRSATLDTMARSIIERADTFFVASVNPRSEDGIARGADVSHRGGRPGFVRVDDAVTITTPDFVGNFIFNTLGNFQIDSHAGLLFIDFDRGDTLYVAARAEVIWAGAELKAFAGAQRLVRYHISQVIRVEGAVPLRFSAPDFSPLLARTGTWTEVAGALEAEARRSTWRPFRIAQIETECRNVLSFYLEPADGAGLASFLPGQFLPVRMQLHHGEPPEIRSYTLSDAPGAGLYRISVKRGGSGGVSDALHRATVGTIIETLAPRGNFMFVSPPNRPAVLIAAGIGVTPLLAMLNSILINNGRTRHHAPIYFISGARDGEHLPFATHLQRKASLHSNLRLHVRLSRPTPADVLGTSYDSVGHIDVALIKSLLPFDDYDFYLCGPSAFMQGLYEQLTAIGVRDERIHYESFGPASMRRTRTGAPSSATRDEEAVRVEFARSGRLERWQPRQGSLLELAEQAGVAALSGCRSGVCGTCSVRLIRGSVDYREPPAHEIPPGEALICVAQPLPGPHLDGTADREGVTLDL